MRRKRRATECGRDERNGESTWTAAGGHEVDGRAVGRHAFGDASVSPAHLALRRPVHSMRW
jgi:hypothetical protein